MKIHHLNYTRNEATNALGIPEGEAMLEQLKAFSDLKEGDQISMQDGSLAGYFVVDNLTGYFGHETEEHCKAIFQSCKPALIAVEPTKTRDNKTIVVKNNVYSDRTIIMANGKTRKQILIKAFGELVWINANNHTKVYREDDYKGEDLFHPM